MSREVWFPPKWKWLRRFAIAAAMGLVAALVIALSTRSGPDVSWAAPLMFIAFLAIVPLAFWLCFVPIMHWRERYKGSHPGIWGAFLVFETSGWSKLFYWFMHVLPDANGSGRYRDAP